MWGVLHERPTARHGAGTGTGSTTDGTSQEQAAYGGATHS